MEQKLKTYRVRVPMYQDYLVKATHPSEAILFQAEGNGELFGDVLVDDERQGIAFEFHNMIRGSK